MIRKIRITIGAMRLIWRYAKAAYMDERRHGEIYRAQVDAMERAARRWARQVDRRDLN